MIRRFFTSPTLFAFVIAVSGAFLLCNWAVCEQDDSKCMFTGVPSK